MCWNIIGKTRGSPWPARRDFGSHIRWSISGEAPGKTRLRRIAKNCVNYGQRVQNSVFECLLDAGQCRSLQAKLLAIMDPEKDSLRFYYLGNRYEKKVEHFGCKNTYLPEDTLMI